MRKLLGLMLPLLVLVALTAGEMQTTTGGVKHATLQRVDVVRADDGISVEITAPGAVTPKLTTLDSPSRVVMTLANTVSAASENHIVVGRDGVKGIRIGTDGQTPPTTSVVIDLLKPCAYELVPGSGKLVIKLHPSATTATSVAPPALPVQQVASAQLAPATLVPVSAKASTPSASDFVMVEPSYSKAATDAHKADANQPTVAAPQVRASDAAAKFVEKPEGNLLPVASASMSGQSGASPNSIQPAVNLAAEQKSQVSALPVAAEPKYTGEPISVNLKNVDLKDFFRLIHEISGLNVVLDPNVKGSLTIVLDDVPWDQALDIVLKNNDLARQLDGNVLRVATVETLRKEADSRRAQHEAEALAVDKVTFTRFMSYAHAKDLVPTVKKFVTLRGDVIADERTNAIIVTDVPSVVPTIDKLLTQLDRKTQQVEIEARVVAATRSFARDIGTQLGFGFGNAATSVGGASAVGTSPTATFGVAPFYPIIGTSAPSPTTGAQIPLFSNLGSTSPPAAST